MTGSLQHHGVPDQRPRSRSQHSFHRPRILLVLLFLLLLSAIVQAQTDDSTNDGFTVSETPTDPTETFSDISAESTSWDTTPSATKHVPSPTGLTNGVTSAITIPQPFDTAQLSDQGNFTSASCPEFMRSFLNETAFQQCVPFSMLLYTSSAFFALTRSGSFAVSQVLDAACEASPKTCGAIMDVIASELVQDSNCGQDIQAQNPLVLEALTGLQNYLLYYGAGCLKDNATDLYCYTLAITNNTNPADAQTYYLPTIGMVSGERPSCNHCTQQLFDVYYSFSSNSTLEISKNYLEAAQIVDLSCGVNFVSTSVTLKESGAAEVSITTWVRWLPMIVWTMALWMIL